MRFAGGFYTLLVSAACFPRLSLLLEDLKTSGTEPSKFLRSLVILKADISRGAEIVDLEALGGHPDDYAITLHGYRVLLRVNSALFKVTLIDVDDG